jgi:hypothetical protein
MRRSWLWMFLGFCFLAAVLSGPARLTTGPGHGTSPAATLPHTLVAADVARIPHSQAQDLTPQQIIFDQPQDAWVGQQVPLTASSGTTTSPPPGTMPPPIVFRSDTPAMCTVSGSVAIPTAAGFCVITASQAGDGNYAPAPDVARAFRAHAGSEPQTITFDQPTAGKVGEPVALSASSVTTTSPPEPTGLTVLFRSDTPGVCTVTDSTVTTTTADVCTITAFQGGSDRYAAANPIQHSFQASTGSEPQTITFDQPPTTPVGQQVAVSAFTNAESLQVSFRSGSPTVCSVSGSTVTAIAAGTCTITAFQGGNATYQAAQTPIVFRVTDAYRHQQQIQFPPVSGATVGVPIILSATSMTAGHVTAILPTGLTVSFRSQPRRVCTVSGSTLIPWTTGYCTITAFQGGSAEYMPASEQQTVLVGRASQTLSFTPPPGATVNQPVTLTATASSWLPVTYTSDTQDVCTVSGAIVTPTAGGTCTIIASQPGDNSYAPADAVSGSFPVAKLSQTISFTAPANVTVGQPVTLTATASSNLPVTYTSSTTDVCTVSGTTLTPVKAGTCGITASQPGNGQYLPAGSVPQSFPVVSAQTITFTAPNEATAGRPVTLTATASSSLPVTYTSSTTDVCTVSGTTLTPVKAGTCIITASQAGNDEYLPAKPVTQSFPVRKISQEISFTPPADAMAGQPVTLSAKASSGLPVSYTPDNPGACPVSGTTVTPAEGGTCTITASQAGNDKYAAAQPVMKSFPVARIAQTMDFRQPPDTVFGKPVTLQARASSRLNVSFSTDSPDVCTVSGSAVTTTAAGTCQITASQAGNARYAPARAVARSFQVGKAPQTITFTPPDGATMGQRVTLSATASSGLPVSFSTSTPDVCTVSGSTVTPVLAGTCAITASQGGSGTYLAAPDVPQSLPVHPGGGNQGDRHSQSITFGQPAAATVGQTVSLSASATSGLEVSFHSDTPSVCTVSGTTVTTATVGTCAVTASQAGDDRFRPARDMQRAFTVHARQTQGTETGGGGNNTGGNTTHGHKTSQAIIFGQPTAAAVGQVVPLSASTTSGLAASFSSDTPSVCAVSGTTVTTTAAGTCAVTASQAGDSHYLAAQEIAQSFQVHAGHRRQMITFPPPPEATVGDPVTLSASASSGLTVAYRSDTPRTCTVSASTVSPAAAGTCTVTASQGGSDRYAAAREVKQSFQVAASSSILPNALKFLLGAAVLAAAGVTALVRRVRRPRRPPPPQPTLRVAPDPGPPTLVSVQNTEAGVPHSVRLEPSPGASIITIKEAKP